ncbi:hypothetical protein [Pinisolibacter aquiterrae]|uniref:hypothetical protein n=1 Tax=Pinisolibacter aquiterrae TaxID=2815579 RepID=UPI001E471D16|nr:hypothetical protein [Pinisolibacter aquiterrae]MCC8234753.1 hypothetical protein [Pinisolibacter aquiterrae]
MVDRHPVEPGAEILLDLGHQVAREAGEIVEGDPILGRDDEAELVAIVLATREEGITVGAILARRIELAALAIPRGAVALDVAQMRRRATALPCRPDEARLDHHPARTGLPMAPTATEITGTDEGCSTPTGHSATGRTPEPRCRRGYSRADRGPGRSTHPMLPGNLADLGEEAGRGLAVATTPHPTGLRPKPMFVVTTHGRHSRLHTQNR